MIGQEPRAAAHGVQVERLLTPLCPPDLRSLRERHVNFEALHRSNRQMVVDTSSNAPLLVVALSVLTVALPLCLGCTPLVSGTFPDRTTESARVRVLERAVEYGEKIEHPGFRTDLFIDLAPSYVEIGETERAIGIADRIAHARDRALVGISRKQVELGQIEEALKTAAMIKGTPWKVRALKNIAPELAKHTKKGEALKLISQAKEAALSEEDIGYLYVKANDLLSLAEMQWAAQDELGARVTVKQAIEFFEGRPDQDALGKALFFSDVAELYARMGDKAGMLATVQRIPIGGDRDMALRNAAEAQAESGDTRGALNTAAMIEGPGYRDSALYRVARLQAKGDDIHGAFETTTAITHHMMWKAFALTHIAEAQDARSDREAALQTLSQAESFARTIPDADERADTFGVIAQIQAKLGDTNGAAANIQTALLLVDQIKDSELCDRALTEIVKAQIRTGDIKGALISADAMDRSFRQFSVHSQIAEAQARTADFAGAVQTAQKSHPGEEGLWRASTFQLIARIQAQQGQAHEAEEWAVNLSFQSDVAWAFLGIAEGLITQGKGNR